MRQAAHPYLCPLGKGVLEPKQAHVPTIEQPVYAPFCLDQPVGSTWEFKLRKGLLGFWHTTAVLC